MADGDVSFATFNLYNLNEPGLRIYNDVDGWTQEQYDKKIEWTARQLQRVDADVFGFQELWHADSLRAAFDAAGLSSQYTLLIPTEGDNAANGTRIVCAAAIRKELVIEDEGPEWISEFPEGFLLQSDGDEQSPRIKVELSGFHRPVLHAQLRPKSDAPPVHLYVSHLKSKSPARIWRDEWYNADRDTFRDHSGHLGSALSTLRRTAEAAALRWILTLRMKGTTDPVVLLGDLNDGQHSNTLNIITEQPKFLTSLRSGGRDNALYSAQALQQLRSLRDVYYTHVHKDVRQSLDHILVSEEFYDMSRRRIWAFDGMTIENDHLNVKDPKDHKPRGTGDHGIVKASFKHKPVKTE
ncbi:MAG: endonuclease/exonuclease/phosphatase family protein [Pseudomonadota bacterium]